MHFNGLATMLKRMKTFTEKLLLLGRGIPFPVGTSHKGENLLFLYE